MDPNLPSFGKADTGRRFVLNYGTNKNPVPMQKYRITMDDGKVVSGVTDAMGRTELVESDQMRVAHVEFLEDKTT